MARKRLKGPSREKLRLKKKKANAKLALRFLKHELPGTDLAAIPFTGALKAFRAAMAAPLHADVRAAVIDRLTAALAKEFGSMTIKPADLGLTDAHALAELFVEMLERTDYADYTVKELRPVARGQYARTPGLRSVFAGEFFEVVVRNLRELQTELKAMAQDLLDDMDGIVKGTATGRPPLLDGAGNVLNLSGTFGPIRKLTDIVERLPGNVSLKFIDFMYVSEFTPTGGGPKRLAILLESEYKLPGAARQLRKQVGSALGRLTTSEGIAGVFDDTKTAVPFDRKNLIFSQTAMTRTAVSPSSSSKANYRWVTTKKGGYQESYLHVKAAVDVDELYRVVNLLFSMTK